MKTIFRNILTLIFLVASVPLAPAQEEAPAQRLLAMEAIAVAADTVMANYDADWEQLSMQGRLQFDGLPMRLSVKVYMERGKSVLISARAPIFGEVARVEILGDSITLINKSSRTYHVISLAPVAAGMPGILADVQDLLLGQMAFPGYGRLNQQLARQARWIAMPDAKTIVFPDETLQPPGSQCGFVLDEAMQLSAFAIALAQARLEVQTTYLYGEEGWTLGIDILMRGKEMQGSLELSYPDYSPTPLQPTALDKRYRKVDFSQLMKY